MLFIDILNNFIAGTDHVRNQIKIESTLREKLPPMLEFISGQPFIDLFLKFYVRRNEHGCIINIDGNCFEFTSIHCHNNQEFTCDIGFKTKLHFLPVNNVTCQLDENLNIKNFKYKMNFGSFGSNNSLYIENTKYFNGNHKRNIYIQNVNSHAKVVIDKLDNSVHEENRNFELFLSKILLINYTKPEFYLDAFHYLSVIDMNDTIVMSSFINELHSRYIKNDKLLDQSLQLLDIHDF